MDEEPPLSLDAKARSKSDSQLREAFGYNEGSPLRAAAETELARRQFWKTFWSHGMPAWVALIISILSLSVSAYVAFVKHG